ncbi:MAG: transglutaminase-like domain-containing protein [Planctomycetaceae bacterium]|nr:transglutaminase-like domain-containing protein [Planctomycetaceae bacterium]
MNLDYPEDDEFSKLLRRQREVNLPVVALEIARDAYPQLDFAHSLCWIAKRGSELIAPASRCHSDRALLKEIGRSLAGTHGLHGDKEAFHRPEASYLHRVIETGVGIPISLSLVYSAVAEEAGIQLSGVAAPMHFLTRYDGAGGTFFVDAFNQGRVLNYDRAVRWLQEMTELTPDEIEPMLEPARPRDIVIRMLNNLKALYVQQEQWDSIWSVQRRLTALQPTVFDQRRDLALVALKTNRPGLAIDLLQRCMNDSDDEKDRRTIAQYLQAAEQMLSTWN